MLTQHTLCLEEAQVFRPSRKRVVFLPPTVDASPDIFVQAMLEEDPMHQRRNPLEWLASTLVHAVLLGFVLVLPLFYASGLDMHRFNMTLLVAPQPPVAAPRLLMASAIAPRVACPTPTRVFIPGKLTAPYFIPKAIAAVPAEIAPPEEAVVGVPGGVLGEIPGGLTGGQVRGILGGIPMGEEKSMGAPVARMAEGPRRALQVGGAVKQPRLLYAPEPEYPVLAQRSHIAGVVVIEALIDEKGDVTEAHVVSGHPLLITSALKAVSKRKYVPTYLDGLAMQVSLRVILSFDFR